MDMLTDCWKSDYWGIVKVFRKCQR